MLKLTKRANVTDDLTLIIDYISTRKYLDLLRISQLREFYLYPQLNIRYT